MDPLIKKIHNNKNDTQKTVSLEFEEVGLWGPPKKL